MTRSDPPRSGDSRDSRRESAPASEKRLLVIDDNPRIHEDFRRLLRREAIPVALESAEACFRGRPPDDPDAEVFEIETALAGEAALELLKAAREQGVVYAAAFVDIRLGSGWDGLTTARELWKVEPDLPVVFCTAYADYTWAEMSRSLAPHRDYLVLKKPFDALEIRGLARSLAAKRDLLARFAAKMETLEATLRQRAAQLERANSQLQVEITERTVLEQGLRQAQKLEALGRLAAGIGHEINNPLAYVLSNLEFAIAEIQTVTADRPHPQLTAVCDVLAEAVLGAERIKKIVHGVRLYSRPWEASASEMNLHQSLRAALLIVANEIRHRAQVIEDLAELPPVVGDPNRIEQVLVNLLMHALRSFPPYDPLKNVIRITTRTAQTGEVVLTMSDNGRGMAQPDLQRAFEPFYSTRQVGTGEGVGLWVCKCIVEGLGGRIHLESAEGQGTTVTVVLQQAVTSARMKALSLAPSPRKSQRRARVLIVDDEVPLLRSLQRSLREHETTVCRDGQEALQIYETQAFDLVLCDLAMPRLSGMELYSKLASMGPEHARRVVFMTGAVLTEPIRNFLASIENPWLGKPFPTQELLETVSHQLTLNLRRSGA